MDQTRSWPLPLAEHDLLDLKADALPLTLLPIEPGQSPRLVADGPDAQRVVVSTDRAGDELRVHVEQDGLWTWFSRWDLRVLVYLPRDLRARVRTDAGTIDVRGLGRCDLELKTNAGALTLVDLQGRLVAKTNAGNVDAMRLGPIDADLRTDAGRIGLCEARGRFALHTNAGPITVARLEGAVDAHTNMGSIKVDAQQLTPGVHTLKTEAGSIQVSLAPEVRVQLRTRTAMGAVHSAVTSVPDAPAVLELHTNVGSIRVDTSPSAPAPPPPPPNPEVERILKLVESGELSARDADELLRALG
jgi:hypothetical protein